MRAEPSLTEFLRGALVDLVVDAGANTGQFAGGLREEGYVGAILSVEPVSAAFEILSGRAGRDRHWRAVRMALGRQQGRAAINVAHDTAYSSLLEPLHGVEADHSGIATASREEVGLTTLDLLLADENAARPFIKLDVQGFEEEVLAGGVQTLERAAGLQLELSAARLYRGGWSFWQGIAALDRAGFVPAQVRPVWVDPAHPGCAGEFDVVFRRK